MLDLKRLRVFEAVAVQGSFQAAARALSYTAPAISHHIAQLERDVGARLVVRRGAGPRLTPAGELLLVRAREILGAVADAERALAEVGRQQARLRVGAFATAAQTLVADAFVDVARDAPALQLGLVEGELPETLRRLERREIDIGVVFHDPDAALACVHDRTLETEPLGSDPFDVALPAGHPLSGRDELRLRDLADEAWIEGAHPDSPASAILARACGAAGFRPRVAHDSGNFHVAMRLVAAGAGVALIPRLAACGRPDGVVLRSLVEPTPMRLVAAVQRRERTAPGRRRAVSAALRRQSAAWLQPLPRCSDREPRRRDEKS